MKIEPQKTNKIPKYAAALASLASAAMLTACQPSGEMVVTDSAAPAPVIDDSNLELDGVAVTDAPELSEGGGTEPETTETTTVMPDATTAPDDEAFLLEGDVVCMPETTETETGEAP